MISGQVVSTCSEYRGHHEKMQKKIFMEVLRNGFGGVQGEKA